jgi:hypothetical protein
MRAARVLEAQRIYTPPQGRAEIVCWVSVTPTWPCSLTVAKSVDAGGHSEHLTGVFDR